MRGNKVLITTVLLVIMALMAMALLCGCGNSQSATTTSAATAPTATTATTAPAATTSTSAAPATSASAVETTTAGTTGTTAYAGTYDGTITIGALASMTGSLAMGGAEQKWGQEQAAKDINAAGGIVVGGKHMKLEIKFVDDQSDSNQAAAGAEKLIKAEGLKIILGTDSTPPNMAGATVAEKYGVLYTTNYLWTDWTRQQNWKWVCNSCFSPATLTEAMYNEMDQQPQAERPTSWAIVTEDNSDGQSLGGALKAMAEKHGYAVKSYETYTPGTKDFSSVVLKLQQNNIDGLVFLAAPADAITFVKQMKQQNFAPKFAFGIKGVWPIQFEESLGAEAEFFSYDGQWSEQLPYPGCAELGAKYKAATGLDSVSIGSGYSVVQVLARAIEAAGSTDPAAVIAQIKGHTFKGTVMGDLTYDAQGVNDVPIMCLQWINGKRVLVYPNGSSLEWMKPWNQR